jgi:DNA-binding protein H-NS
MSDSPTAQTETPYEQALREAKEAERRAEVIRRLEAKKVIVEIREKMRIYGLTAKDLGFLDPDEGAKKTDRRTQVEPRYISPTGLTWAGRGKKPAWVQAHLDAGGDLEDFAITKEGPNHE